ncbi:MAG: universal stress protein [Rhodoferax sp.]|uniref:universal stress protein n=1 Tax=Rhodoferax sp. TaxID=50421 RepID=UPI00262E3895|nr:universal stress protein [Rhodoferax sp.]MDD5335483.1 universal stress protein [Rhodoferax sp.]
MYQRILVPIDGSATSNQGLDEAIKLAKLTGASIRLAHVMDTWSVATGFEPYGVYVADVIPRMKEAGEQLLAQAKTRVQEQGVKVDSLLLDSLATRVSEAVIEQAKAWGADLIVIGTHGRRGVGRLLLGSDAEQIVRMASVPVLLVRAPEVKDSSAAAA